MIQGQFANIEDLQLFYADQVPAAVGTNFTFVSVDGNFTQRNFKLSNILCSLKAELITKHQQTLVMKPILTRSLLLASLTQFQ